MPSSWRRGLSYPEFHALFQYFVLRIRPQIPKEEKKKKKEKPWPPDTSVIFKLGRHSSFRLRALNWMLGRKGLQIRIKRNFHDSSFSILVHLLDSSSIRHGTSSSAFPFSCLDWTLFSSNDSRKLWRTLSFIELSRGGVVRTWLSRVRPPEAPRQLDKYLLERRRRSIKSWNISMQANKYTLLSSIKDQSMKQCPTDLDYILELVRENEARRTGAPGRVGYTP